MSFSAQITDFVKTVKKRQALVTRKLGEEILTSVVRLSPVDTGLFRNNWRVGINTPFRGTVQTTDRSGNRAIGVGKRTLANVKPGDVLFISNNLPYAQALEYGWSKQAPAGMVRITMGRYSSMLARAVREAKAEIP